MKKIFYVILSVLIFSIAAALGWHYLKKDTVVIAVAGPMTGPSWSSGKEMLNGARLYLDQMKENGPHDLEIKIQEVDDQNDEQTAWEAARKISTGKEAVLVIGHLDSKPSLAAGAVYKKNEIAALTGSATGQDVTRGNPWYFRIIGDDRFQGSYIANVVSRALKKKTASIVYDTGSQSTSLAESFEETAVMLGIEIMVKAAFDMKSDNLDTWLSRVSDQLAAGDPGIIFLAADTTLAARLIVSLKTRPDHKDYAFIGSHRFSDPQFVHLFADYPQEKETPGYFINGIYALSPYILEIGNDKVHAFRKAYLKKYKQDPTWIALSYYEAMHMAVEAVRMADLNGKGRIRSDRRKIKEVLEKLYDLDHAFQGLSGPIYFNMHGNAERPYAVGFYDKNFFIPAFIQYHPLNYFREEDSVQKVLDGEYMLVNGRMNKRLQVVYAGAHIHALTGMDIRNLHYQVDVFLWFRFRETFKDNAIDVINFFTPIQPGDAGTAPALKSTDLLDTLLAEEENNGIITRVYRLKTTLKTEFDFRAFPLDAHQVPIRFRHMDMTRDKLIYTPDLWDFPKSLGRFLQDMAAETRNPSQDAAAGWKVSDAVSLNEDIVTNVSTLGNPRFFDAPHAVTFSQFSAGVEIRRTTREIIKGFLPMLIAAGILFAGYFTPAAWLGRRLGFFITAMLITTLYHGKILVDIPVDYLLFIEYLMIDLYVLGVIFLILSAWMYKRHRWNLSVKKIGFAAKIFHAAGVLAGIILYSMSVIT